MEEAGSVSTSVVLKLNQGLLLFLSPPLLWISNLHSAMHWGEEKRSPPQKKTHKKTKPTFFLTVCNNTFVINKLCVYM